MKNEIQILSIDAWADSYNGGWTWNNWFRVGKIPSECLNWTNRKLLKWLRENNYLSLESAGKVAIEDDGYNIVIKEKSNGCPVLAIEYGNDI